VDKLQHAQVVDDGPENSRTARTAPLQVVASDGQARLWPDDWPEDGPIDLAIHDLPHCSASTEWWYLNGHVGLVDGREISFFASFFRIVKSIDEETKEPQYAHSLAWALCHEDAKTYVSESLVSKHAPQMGIEQVNRGEGSSDERLRRAIREVLEKGKVPYPDQMFEEGATVSRRRLALDYDGNTFTKLTEGRYRLQLKHKQEKVGLDIVLTLEKPPIRHGENGVVRGRAGEEMFYYFVPRCAITGSVTLEGRRVAVEEGIAWYDHEFGGYPEASEEDHCKENIAWNWTGIQLENGAELSAYEMFDLEQGGAAVGRRVVYVQPDGERLETEDFKFTPLREWVSTRTFNSYATQWRLEVPSLGLDLFLDTEFEDQEFITVISKPAFWEGRISATGTLSGQAIAGLGFAERSGLGAVDGLEDFFKAVGRETRKSVQALIPFDPTYEQVRDLVASEERDSYMRGVDTQQFVDSMVRPVREIADRGGKSWRSYAALACCDVVGGDSRNYVRWLAMPELMHVGSLIVDDVQDQSEIRRGGTSCHLMYGEPLAINAGTAAYFMGQRLLVDDDMSNATKIRLYDLYFESLRAGHAGQAFDLGGLDSMMDKVIDTGLSADLEERVLAIHRLKTAAPAAALARMGAVVGEGSEEQIEAVGCFFEAVGLAFQIIDDVLNLRGFEGKLKTRGEDITQGKVTLPIAKAMSRLPLEARRILWNQIAAKPTEQPVIEEVIAKLEACDAIEDCVTQAHELVENAWRDLDPLLEDSLVKLMLRAFGWFVLERHY
jgi:geranylgeranyl pyrophosphate synthase/predicted secreted hydrolase